MRNTGSNVLTTLKYFEGNRRDQFVLFSKYLNGATEETHKSAE
jgi:hypothetical protein